MKLKKLEKQESRTLQMLVRVRPSIKKEAMDIAIEQGFSLSEVVDQLLEQYVEFNNDSNAGKHKRSNNSSKKSR
jgi:predicted HicB family RNase H-like nuclease